MAKSYQPCLFLLFFVFSLLIDYSICLSNSPQNIETFYPSDPPSSAPTLSPPIQQSQPPPPPPPPSKKSSTRKAVGTAVGVTAACTLVLAGLFFFFLQRCRTRRRDQANNGSGRPQPIVQLNSFQKFERNLKGLIVDENGLDVVYWRKLEGSKYKNSYRKEVLHKAKDEGQDEEEKRVIYKAGSRRKKAEPIQETPLLRGKSSTSQNPISPENKDFIPIKDPELRTQSSGITLMALEKQQSIKFQPQPPILEISEKQSPSPPPPRPPPPLPITAKKNPAPPPPPPIAAKKNPVPPPPPPKTGSLSSSSKPPPVPKAIASDAKIGKSSSGNSDGQVKLKPLHWDKVNANVDHSMVWDKLDGGSFRY